MNDAQKATLKIKILNEFATTDDKNYAGKSAFNSVSLLKGSAESGPDVRIQIDHKTSGPSEANLDNTYKHMLDYRADFEAFKDKYYKQFKEEVIANIP